MTEQKLSLYRIYFIAVVSLAVWTLLAWRYFHGGIPSHHLLANPDLPSVSNAWGALLIPLITVYLSYRIKKKLLEEKTPADRVALKKVILHFAFAALYAITIALAFTFEFPEMSDYLFRGLLVMAVILPLYRAEYYLGFVLGLTYFFGAVLPTFIGGVIVLVSAIANFGLHPLIFKMRDIFKSKS